MEDFMSLNFMRLIEVFLVCFILYFERITNEGLIHVTRSLCLVIVLRRIIDYGYITAPL